MAPRILVVDDEEDIRTILDHILSPQGFEVVQAAAGDEALRLLSEQSFDLMLLDIMMPGVDGFTVLEQLDKSVLESMPVILLTAKGADADVLRGYSEGASLYLTKPFDNINLLKAVNSMLNRDER